MKTVIILTLLALISALSGCVATDHVPLYGDPVYSWNGTAYNPVSTGNTTAEVDPVWTASPSFGITALNIAAWNNAPTLYVPYTGAIGNINLNAKEVTNGTLNAMVSKGTWTASGTWKLPAMFFNGDITTDRWLSNATNTFLGVNVVGAGNLAHTVGGTGWQNTAVGNNALYENTIGYQNSAFGVDALKKNTEGYFNSSFGTDSMLFNTVGNFNTAVGVGALTYNDSGSFNTAIGVQASDNNTSGLYNTAIGAQSGFSNHTGDRNVFIGFQAGYFELGSDTLYIDNSDTLTPLIYGDFATNELTFNGDLHIVAGSIDMSQIGVEPSSTANRAGLYALDLSADNCTIGFFTETAVQSAFASVVTNRVPVRWNGATHYLLMEATGFKTPVVNDVEPTVEQGLQVGIIFFNTNTNTWKKCTGISPVTWETLSSGGTPTWGGITGTLSAQTDLQGVLDSKLSSFTELDPLWVASASHGIVSGDITNWNNKLSSYTETDPIVKALTGIIVSNGSVISAITDSHSNWDAGYTYRLTSASGTLPLTLTLSTNGLTGSVDLSSKQNASTSLTSLAGLSWTSGSPLVKMTAANTFGLDTNVYVTSSVATLSSLASIGTITTGTWNGSVIGGQWGGTGVANTGKTITIGGNFAMSGAFTFTGTLSNNTAINFPTTGTLATTTDLSSYIAKSIGTAKGDTIGFTASGTPINLAYSGVNNNVLTVDTTTATGLKWAAVSGGSNALLDGVSHTDTTAGVVARGDVITGQGTTAKWTKLLKGTANQVLSMDATGTDVLWVTPVGGSNPAWYGKFYSTRGNCDPIVQALHENMLAVLGPTPTGIGITVGRCVQFIPPANITVTNIRIFGVGATTSLYKFAIYPVGAGSTKTWDSGTVTTVANTWLNLTSGLPVTLTAGTKYWWCVTAVAVGTVAGFRSDAAPLGTAYWGADVAPLGNTSLGLPIYAQFTVTSPGVFPATLPAIAVAAYASGTTGTVPFGWLDYGGAK